MRSKVETIDIIKSYIDEKYEELFLDYPAINSVGIAYKEVGHQPTNQLCIRFSVEKKIPLTDLTKNQLIPKTRKIVFENKVYRIKTDVVERTPMPQTLAAINQRASRLDPICPGISISGALADGAGTIGLIVKEKNKNKPLILSNWHVLRGDNGNNTNDIHQPRSREYFGNQAIKIGNLVKSHLGKHGDCAICSIDLTQRQIDPFIFGLAIKPTSILQNKDIELKLNVVKSGRTTGVTYGTVNEINKKVKHNYGNASKIINAFEIAPNAIKQPQGTDIVDSGDSGSAWLIDEIARKNVVIGLHFHHHYETMNGNTVRYANACYIDAVFNVLNIELYP